MDTLADSLIGLDPDIPPIPPLSTEDKSNEPVPSLEAILEDKTDETKAEDSLIPLTLIDPVEVTSELEKTQTSMEIEISVTDTEEQSKQTDLAEAIEERIEETKSSLSEFLKVGDDAPQSTEFEDQLESERDKIIEDLMSTTGSTGKDELLTYTAHFDVLSTEKEEIKVDGANTEEVNMDIESALKTDSAEIKDDKIELDVEDKIKELLVDEGDSKEVIDPENVSDKTLELSITKPVETAEVSPIDGGEDKDASKDDIDTLLSTLMPDLESNTKPPVHKKQSTPQSIQYLRDVLDKPDERSSKRKISTDSENDEKPAKKPKVLPNLPEVTLMKVAPKKKQLNFDDLMSNLTKIKLPSALWKVRICAGNNPFSIVEFHEKEKLLRSVKFCKEDFQYKIWFNNVPVELLGAPQHVQSLEDVSALLNIVNTLIKNDPIVNYL